MQHLDLLLEPYQLRHLTLRNRVVSTSREPAYTEDGMPKDRYRLYHLGKARRGVGLTMIGGSAVVSSGSPPAFGNTLLYKDNLGELDDAVLLTGTAQDVSADPAGEFAPWPDRRRRRQRNIHAAVYDALRPCITV